MSDVIDADVIIAGAGLTGATLGLALASAGLTPVLVDPQPFDAQVAPNACIVFDLGYQFGFQSFSATALGQTFDVALRTRYLHFGLGFAVTFGS